MTSGASKPSRNGGGSAPVDASMSLLNQVMRSPLDPGYAAAAERKQLMSERGKSDSNVWVRTSSLLLAVVLGFTTITAVLSLRSRFDVVDGAGALLREQIVERSTEMEHIEARIVEQSQVAQELQADLLESSSVSASPVEQRDGVLNGAVAVTGPGISVKLTDGPNTDEQRDNRVRDTDLRAVVSVLWSSGAEAISVNGKRLTATSAIRSAGDAILVDLVGLSGPYVVSAIGDPQAMEVSFVRNEISHDLLELETRYGIKTTVTRSDSLSLDAGTSKDLLYAEIPTN